MRYEGRLIFSKMQSENRSRGTTVKYAKRFLNAWWHRFERAAGIAILLGEAWNRWYGGRRQSTLAKRQISWKALVPRTPKTLADRIASRHKPADGFRRETFALPREEARARARSILKRYPKAAYMTEVESWRDLGDGRIEFTMKRLPTAD